MHDADIILSCARIAMRYKAATMDREDLIQEGWIAYLDADVEKREFQSAEHRSKYIARRVLGGMIDASRREMSLTKPWLRGSEDEAEEAELRMHTGPNPTLDHVQARQALAKLDRSANPTLHGVLMSIADGQSGREAAESAGLHESRVSQLLASARAMVARWV